METFTEGLLRMLLKFEVVTSQQNENAVLIFACGCAIIGIVAVALDLSFYILRGASLIETRTWKKYHYIPFCMGYRIIHYGLCWSDG